MSTVDALGLATAYFGALQKLADDRGVELVLQGIEITDGSLNIAAHTEQPEVAKESLLVLSGGLTDEGKAPPSVRHVVVQLRWFKNAKVQAWVGRDFERDLSSGTYATPYFIWSTVTLRATPQRVGGVSPPADREKRALEIGNRSNRLRASSRGKENTSAHRFRDPDPP